MPIPDKILQVAEEIETVIESHAEPTRASVARWLRKLKDAVAEDDRGFTNLADGISS